MYVLLLMEQPVPVREAEQVLVPVRTDGRVRVRVSSCGLSGVRGKGEVTVTVRVEVERRTRELVGVQETVRAAAVMVAEAVPCST